MSVVDEIKADLRDRGREDSVVEVSKFDLGIAYGFLIAAAPIVAMSEEHEDADEAAGAMFQIAERLKLAVPKPAG